MWSPRPVRLALLATCCVIPCAARANQGGGSGNPPAAPATASAVTATEDAIVVTGRAVPGAVIGDIPADHQLNMADITAYGVGTLNELLEAITAQTLSAQGRESDGPIVLVNGKRISGVNEIGDLATEAVLRVDILPEEVALRYGYDAKRKVVNVILHRRYRATVGNAAAGLATRGQGENGMADMSYTRIRDNDRIMLTGRARGAASLLESERGLGSAGDPALRSADPAGDESGARTLRPATRAYELNATVARQLGAAVNLTLNLRGAHASSRALNGLATGTLEIAATNPFAAGTAFSLTRVLDTAPLRQTGDDGSLASGLALNADLSRHWRLSLIGGYEHGETRSDNERGYALDSLQAAIDANDPAVDVFGPLPSALLGERRSDHARTLSDSGHASLLVHGRLLALPAGPLGLSLRGGGDFASLRAESRLGGLVSASQLHRTTTSGQASLDLPIASRARHVLAGLGTLGANVNLAVRQVSSREALGTMGYGLYWSPFAGVSIVAAFNQDRSTPGLAQAGDPQLVVENVLVHDPATGEAVHVRRITGGNTALTADDRRLRKLAVTLKPVARLNLTLSAAYSESDTRDAIVTPGGASLALQRAFTSRFLRDQTGRLVQIDARPLNIAREQRRQIRWGVDFTAILRRPRRPAPPPGFTPPGSAQPGFARSGRSDMAAAPIPADQPPEATAQNWRTAPADTPSGAGQDAPQEPVAPPEESVVVTARADAGDAPPFPPPGGFGGPDDFGPPPGPPPDGFGPPPGGFVPQGGPDGSGGPGGPGGPAGPGGFGGGSDNGARLQVTLFHNWTLASRSMLRAGASWIDLLRDGTLGGTAQPRHTVQLNVGLVDNGLGIRLSGHWQSAARVAGDEAASGGDLRFGALASADLRLFVNLANRFAGRRWARGTRLSLTVSNLLDARQDVRDQAGAVPLAYRASRLDPLGRTVGITLRRIF